MGIHLDSNGECVAFSPLSSFCWTCFCWRRLGIIADKIFRREHLLASQRAGVLKPVPVEEKSKFIGSNDVWKGDRKLTKLLWKRMGKGESEPKKERILLLDI